MTDRAIVLEDEGDLCESVVTELERCGFASQSVQSKEEYLAWVDRRDTVLVVVDVFMHGADALRLVMATQERRPTLPLVVITQSPAGVYRAIAMSGRTVDGEYVGALDTGQLALQIQTLLDNRARREAAQHDAYLAVERVP